jgi:hypothetical protein
MRNKYLPSHLILTILVLVNDKLIKITFKQNIIICVSTMTNINIHKVLIHEDI